MDIRKLFFFFWSVVHLLMGYTFHCIARDPLGLESNYQPRSKDGWWWWVLRRPPVFHSTCYGFLRQCRVNLRQVEREIQLWGGMTLLLWLGRTPCWSGGANSTGSGEDFPTGKIDTSVFGGVLSPASSLPLHTIHPNFQDPFLSQTMPSLEQ